MRGRLESAIEVAMDFAYELLARANTMACTSEVAASCAAKGA
jgi:hypothetical protein